jgi:hypothetical protein
VAEGYDDLLILSESEESEIDDLIAACGMQMGHARHLKRSVAELRRQRQSDLQAWQQAAVAASSLVPQ